LNSIHRLNRTDYILNANSNSTHRYLVCELARINNIREAADCSLVSSRSVPMSRQAKQLEDPRNLSVLPMTYVFID